MPYFKYCSEQLYPFLTSFRFLGLIHQNLSQNTYYIYLYQNANSCIYASFSIKFTSIIESMYMNQYTNSLKACIFSDNYFFLYLIYKKIQIRIVTTTTKIQKITVRRILKFSLFSYSLIFFLSLSFSSDIAL